MVWWPLFTLLGTLWWLVPLFVMGAYSPPFLDFIETATVTTFPTTLFDALRGTSDWVPYVVGRLARRQRPADHRLSWRSTAGSCCWLGLAGLHRRGATRTGCSWSLGVLVGLLMVTAGPRGRGRRAGSPAELRGLLDGALAPLRNVHKFDPVIRLPLVLGLAFVLDRVLAAPPRRPRPAGPATSQARLDRVNRSVLVGLVAARGGGCCDCPPLARPLEPAARVTDVPDYWPRPPAGWTTTTAPARALLAPGSAFGDYLWGTPRDEPLQFLAGSPWAVRNAIPLTPRATSGCSTRSRTGSPRAQGSAGLAAFLRRTGVGYLVVRNDLRPRRRRARPGAGAPGPGGLAGADPRGRRSARRGRRRPHEAAACAAWSTAAGRRATPRSRSSASPGAGDVLDRRGPDGRGGRSRGPPRPRRPRRHRPRPVRARRPTCSPAPDARRQARVCADRRPARARALLPADPRRLLGGADPGGPASRRQPEARLRRPR